jgi:hypothetical protein
MKHFSHKLTEKYTIALLDLFDDMQISYRKSDGSSQYVTIPLKFRSRERAANLSEQETEEIIKGNTGIIPRLSLVLNTIEKAPERTTNKYIRSHEIQFEDGLKYTLNSVAYNWSFSILLLARTVTESSQIIEQIAPMFRPSYTLNINEIEMLEEPTTIPLDLLDIQMDIQDEHDDDDIRTIVTEFSFTLRGNMYLPIKEQHVIEHMKVYLDNWFMDNTNEYEKSVLFEKTGSIHPDGTKEISDLEVTDLRPVISAVDPTMAPVIQNIVKYMKEDEPLECSVGEIIELRGVVQDKDNEGEEIIYVWTTTSGMITSNSYLVQYKGLEEGTHTITLVVQDYHGNQALPFTKNIVVTA